MSTSYEKLADDDNKVDSGGEHTTTDQIELTLHDNNHEKTVGTPKHVTIDHTHSENSNDTRKSFGETAFENVKKVTLDIAHEVVKDLETVHTTAQQLINKKSFTKSFKKPIEEHFSEVFDYVMVFPLESSDPNLSYESAKHNGKLIQSKEAKYYISVMIAEGLELFTYLSVQKDELLVMIHCPQSTLSRFADEIDFKVLLDPEVATGLLAKGNPEKKIKKVKINHNPTITKWEPTQYIYGEFNEERNEVSYIVDKIDPETKQRIQEEKGLYYCEPGYDSPFSEQLRLKIIYYLLKAHRKLGGCDMLLNQLIHNGKVTGFYPLHNKKKLAVLLNITLDNYNMPWNQPVELIRDYYGEKIALYNLFLGHYTQYLIYPSVIGFAFQFVVWSYLDFSHPVLPFFGFVITIWSIVWLESWKRLECETALKWGMTDFEQTEQDRPEFEGKVIPSYINGKEMLFFPRKNLIFRMRLSMAFVSSFIMLVVGVVASIYYLRFYLQPKIGTASSTVASVLNSIQITIFNAIYQMVVTALADMENHRTDTEYEDSLIVKLFLFQFVNSYSSFFFIAFIALYLPKPSGADPHFVGQCGADNCMQPLGMNLGIIFGVRLIVQNFVDLGVPYILNKLKFRTETSGVDLNVTPLTPAEKDYVLLPYDPMLDNINNYADTAIQYGYMILFITALPIACFTSVVNSYFKIRVLALRNAYLYQRPIPTGAQDIGQWQTIFTILSVVGVITNAAIICFTMNVLDKNQYTAIQFSKFGKLWIFIGFQWVIISFQFVLAEMIPDIPQHVEIQLQRQEFIVNKLLKYEYDEDYGEEKEEEHDDPVDIASGKKIRKSKTKLPKVVSTGCCGSSQQSFQSKREKKIKNADILPDIETFDYPFHPTSDGHWPEVLSKSPHAHATNAVAPRSEIIELHDIYGENYEVV